MGICAFFGHKEIYDNIESVLKEVLLSLILTKDIDEFYVSNNGAFDAIVTRILKELKQDFPSIKYYIVLAYPALSKSSFDEYNYSNSIFPEEIDGVPKKFAIDRRNEWMLKKSDTVIVYVRFVTGGAAKFYNKALQKGKCVINLYQNPNLNLG